MDRSGTYALVTGAGSGIGEATALKLAAEGAKVAVVGHSRDTAERTARRITDTGGSAFPLAAEPVDPQQVTALFEGIAGRWPRLDVLVANAGTTASGRRSMS